MALGRERSNPHGAAGELTWGTICLVGEGFRGAERRPSRDFVATEQKFDELSKDLAKTNFLLAYFFLEKNQESIEKASEYPKTREKRKAGGRRNVKKGEEPRKIRKEERADLLSVGTLLLARNRGS